MTTIFGSISDCIAATCLLTDFSSPWWSRSPPAEVVLDFRQEQDRIVTAMAMSTSMSPNPANRYGTGEFRCPDPPLKPPEVELFPGLMIPGEGLINLEVEQFRRLIMSVFMAERWKYTVGGLEQIKERLLYGNFIQDTKLSFIFNKGWLFLGQHSFNEIDLVDLDVSFFTWIPSKYIAVNIFIYVDWQESTLTTSIDSVRIKPRLRPTLSQMEVLIYSLRWCNC